MNDKERMEELVKILDKANNDYYVLDAGFRQKVDSF